MTFLFLIVFLYAIGLTFLIGQYISFVKSGQDCPDGDCENITLKSIFSAGLWYSLIAVPYLLKKTVVLFKKFAGDSFNWLDF